MNHIEKPEAETKVKCEVYSRISGYMRPVAQWNPGKKAEFDERKFATVKKPYSASTRSFSTI